MFTGTDREHPTKRNEGAGTVCTPNHSRQQNIALTETGRQTDRQTETESETDRETDRDTERDRQTDREAEAEKGRETEAERNRTITRRK